MDQEEDSDSDFGCTLNSTDTSSNASVSRVGSSDDNNVQNPSPDQSSSSLDYRETTTKFASNNIAKEEFSLNKEMSDGKFVNGLYMQNERSRLDKWLDDTSPGDISTAALAHAKKTKYIHTIEPDVENAFLQLSELLEPCQTATEAIQNNSHDPDIIVQLTMACDALISEYLDIYDIERERLSRLYQLRTGRVFKRKRIYDQEA